MRKEEVCGGKSKRRKTGKGEEAGREKILFLGGKSPFFHAWTTKYIVHSFMRQGLSNSDSKINIFSDTDIIESITGTGYNVRISSAATLSAFMIKLLKIRVKVIKG